MNKKYMLVVVKGLTTKAQKNLLHIFFIYLYRKITLVDVQTSSRKDQKNRGKNGKIRSLC